MRHLFLSVLLLALAAPVASATEPNPAEPSVPELAPTLAAEAPSQGELQLHQIQVEERAAESEAAPAQQLPPRGSFWWLVGVIVVAGVILAVVL